MKQYLIGYYFEDYSGEIEEEATIYQYYILDEYGADELSHRTNEYIIYCKELDLYLLCVTHFGTSWVAVNSSWKAN